MNGSAFLAANEVGDFRPDLLPHKYRPNCTDNLRCHRAQAQRLKQWIQDSLSSSSKQKDQSSHSDCEDSDSYSNFSETAQINRPNCALLTGPPGVGKTSLVYTIASELNLHVVESHSSEKRDSRLFSQLKLTNQKGKINAFTKLFQGAALQQKKEQGENQHNSRRKRRKVAIETIDLNSSEEVTEANKKQSLSLSGDTSIVLFDDIDVFFDEDGPFLKSLVEFIKESKRPVVLTATQSIDHVKTMLVYCEHISLEKPMIDDCALLLRDICKKEKLHKVGKKATCQAIADHYDCDLRQCLNRLHFYGDQAGECLDNLTSDLIPPTIGRLNLDYPESDNNIPVMKCYLNASLVDLMESRLHLDEKSILLQRWLDGVPSSRYEDYDFNQQLGEQIKESIVELTRTLYSNELKSRKITLSDRMQRRSRRDRVIDMGSIMNNRIKSRVEPPEKEFYTDIVPYLGEIIRLDETRKASYQSTNGGTNGFSSLQWTSRRNKKMAYLDMIQVYFEPNEIKLITETLLDPQESDSDEI